MPKVKLLNVPADENYVTIVDDKGNYWGGRASWGPHKRAELQEALTSSYGLDERHTMALMMAFAKSGNTSAEIDVPSVGGKTHFDEPSA